MKVKKVTLLVAMVAMVLGIGSYALAQVAQEPPAQEPAAEQLLAQEPTAQGPATQEAATQEPATQELVAQEEPPTQELPAEQSAAQEPAAQEPAAQAPVLDEASCESTFREEQAELAANGAVYPTSVSEDARACEELGFVNLYPVPYFYDTDGIIYTYDPIADRYTSEADPATGVYHIYDLVTERFYTYDPATGAYL